MDKNKEEGNLVSFRVFLTRDGNVISEFSRLPPLMKLFLDSLVLDGVYPQLFTDSRIYLSKRLPITCWTWSTSKFSSDPMILLFNTSGPIGMFSPFSLLTPSFTTSPLSTSISSSCNTGMKYFILCRALTFIPSTRMVKV